MWKRLIDKFIKNQNKIKQVDSLQGKLVLFGGHVFGITNDGKVQSSAEVYDDDLKSILSWDNIVQLSAGDWQMLGLRSDGTVLAIGDNRYGQCDVSGWNNIKSVVAGHQRSYGIRKDGSVVAIGYNEYGECNVDGWTDIVQITDGPCHTLGLRSDGAVIAVGRGSYNPLEIQSWHNIVKIAAGNVYSMGLSSDGTMVCTEKEFDLSQWKDISDFSATYNSRYILGLKSDGTVMASCCSKDLYNACKVDDWTQNISIKNSRSRSIGLRRDGTIVVTKDPDAFQKGEQDTFNDWKNIVAIFADNDEVIGLRADGTVLIGPQEYPGFCQLLNK